MAYVKTSYEHFIKMYSKEFSRIDVLTSPHLLINEISYSRCNNSKLTITRPRPNQPEPPYPMTSTPETKYCHRRL